MISIYFLEFARGRLDAARAELLAGRGHVVAAVADAEHEDEAALAQASAEAMEEANALLNEADDLISDLITLVV